MNSQHTTDGDWNVAEMTGPNPRITGGPLQVIRAGEDVVLAFVCPWLDSEEEAKEAAANARLFAAAPALLAALEEAREGLAWYQDRNPGQADGSDGEAMARIDAAIAKATTGSPA